MPGGEYRLLVSQSGRLDMRSLEVWLVCREEATYRQGTNTRTETREVRRLAVFRREAFEIRPGEPFQAECSVCVPAGAMHSFQADHNEIDWKLVVRGDVVDWHAFQRAFPVIVHPRRRAAGSGERRPMNEPAILIRLDGRPRTYRPGQSLSGEYRLESVEGDPIRAVEVSVLWYTEGKGEQDLAVHEFWRRDSRQRRLDRSPPARTLQHHAAGEPA